MAIEPGTTLGRYQILGELGHGGMASVYKAFQPALERVVALKVLRPAYAHDPEFLERFRREALAIARLRHPHIVQVHDFDAVGELVFLVMEHIEGGTLKQKLREGPGSAGLPWAEIGRIVGEVAEGLSHAHAQGIVHRDVKPSNVMLTRDGRAVVTDFGIAKILAAAKQTETGVGIGTPEYMSPEQGQSGAIDHRSDIYSLGVLAYEALTGRVPFVADTPLGVMLAHVREPLPLPSKIEPKIGTRIEQVLLRALAKDPAARYQTATGFAEALEAAVAGQDRGTTIATVVSPGARSVPESPPPGGISLRRQPFRVTDRTFIASVLGGVLLIYVAGSNLIGPLRQAQPGTGTPPVAEPSSASARLLPGTNVKATLAALAGEKPATVTFALVSAPGEVSVKATTAGPVLPLGVTLASRTYFDITTTAKFDKATVCFENENVTSRSKLLHYTESAWHDRTTTVAPPQICGEFSSFSPVAIVEVSISVAPRTTAAPTPSAGPAASVTGVPVTPPLSGAAATPLPTSATTVPSTAVPVLPTPAPTIPPTAATLAPTIPPLLATPPSTIVPAAVPTSAPGELLVTGRVTSASSGIGIASVNIRVSPSTGECCPTVRAIGTDASGSYAVSVPPGRYRILFEASSASSYAPRWWPNALGSDSAGELVVSGADRSGVNVALPDGHLVTGRVVDAATGAALSAVQVVVNAGDGNLVTSPLVGSDGSFAIRLVNATYRFSYRLEAGRDNTDRSSHTVVVAGSNFDVGVIRVAL